ncbi:MAG: ABC transporter substrate-binding protein [Moorellaceae bacterium]
MRTPFMAKRILALLLVSVWLVVSGGCSHQAPTEAGKVQEKSTEITVAVEYTDHAAGFYVAQEKGWFDEAGLQVRSCNVYATGTALAAALTKGDIDVAYICLVPALTAYAHGGVPLKIVAGTHKNGYALVANQTKVREVKDLEKEEVKIANMQPGSTTDLLFTLLLRQKGLNEEKILARTARMNPAKQLLALQTGKVDAVFVPEHFATMAGKLPGMGVLARSQDIWPDMQGSVLIVTEGLLKKDPQAVEKLRSINARALDYINRYPEEAANIVAARLNEYQSVVKNEMASPEASLEVTPAIVRESMVNLRYTPDLEAQEVQKVIDLMESYGYLKNPVSAEQLWSKP